MNSRHTVSSPPPRFARFQFPLQFLFLFLFLSFSAQAHDRKSPLTLFINPGVGVGAQTTSTYRLTDGTFLETTRSNDVTSRLIEWEVHYNFFQYFSLGAAVQGNKYKNPNGELPDSHFAFMAVPRLQTGDDGLTFWAGCGLGVITSKRGQAARTGIALDYELELSGSSFALSPRAGLDWVLEGYTFGLQFSYIRTSGEFTGTAIDRVTQITAGMVDTFERSWWSITAKFGFQL